MGHRNNSHQIRASVFSATLGIFFAGFAPSAIANDTAVTVKVLWTGKPVPRRAVPMDRQCSGFHGGKPPKQPTVIIDKQPDGSMTLRNVFVYIDNPPRADYPVPKTPKTLDQKNCIYHPHVQGIRVGQPLKITNSDPAFHNVRSLPKHNDAVNIAQPMQSMVDTTMFDHVEVMVPIKCDIHPWMAAYIGVLDHPFFHTTDRSGVATISGLPAGTYKGVAWHEKYGKKTFDVTISTNKTTNIDITYSATDKR